mgnify:CR=1 FL=1
MQFFILFIGTMVFVFFHFERPPVLFQPADQRKLEVITWYLKLDGERGALPSWGVVRVELPRAYFEGAIQRDYRYLDWLSGHILALRCARASYPRGPVSLEPIVRAEESLKSLFSDPRWLTQRFYHLTGL